MPDGIRVPVSSGSDVRHSLTYVWNRLTACPAGRAFGLIDARPAGPAGHAVKRQVFALTICNWAQSNLG